MNPVEVIENSEELSAILKGLTEMWHYPEDFLGMIVFHTREFDVANNTVEYFSDEDIGLEEALFQAMEVADFKENCLDSEYLDKDKCKELVDECEE